MTNLQQGASQVPDPRLKQVLMLAPVLLGALMAGGLMASLAWPALQEVQADQRRVGELRSLELRLPLLRQQLETERRQGEMAALRQKTLLQLIAGSGNLSTFLSEVERLALRSGVRLDLYEPATANLSPETASSQRRNQRASRRRSQPNDSNAVPRQRPDPLLSQGLEKRSLMLMARGTMPQLLAFLRSLEGLSVLVVQSDLDLDLEEIKAAQPEAVAPGSDASQTKVSTPEVPKQLPTWVALKLAVGLYEKNATGSSPPVGRKPPAAASW